MWSCFKASTKREPENDFFLPNGALLLENLIVSCDGKSNPIHMFSAKQLKIATDNYKHPQSYSHNYTLYSGTLDNDRVILVKKFQEYDTLFTKEAINEIVITSQINEHRKVLNLLGCCLETKAPILVFEFPCNGTLSDHIYDNHTCHVVLPWEKRLRISVDIADAVSYLHLAKSNPIIHRVITSRNIFLDKHLGAKISDFGQSVIVPTGETHVEAEVVGAFGFSAPESTSTGKYTEKSDVFSVGAVLFELLTGKRACEILREILSTQGSQKVETVDIVARTYLNANMLQVGKMEQLKACAKIALRCTKENPEERPEMKQVAQELRQITRF